MTDASPFKLSSATVACGISCQATVMPTLQPSSQPSHQRAVHASLSPTSCTGSGHLPLLRPLTGLCWIPASAGLGSRTHPSPVLSYYHGHLMLSVFALSFVTHFLFVVFHSVFLFTQHWFSVISKLES